MRREHVSLLVCPDCRGTLSLTSGGEAEIVSGELTCAECRRGYPIVNGVPRFVSSDNYASTFGFEWQRHSRTQYDSDSGTHISETRFFDETGWARNLYGETILEVGGGSGRFTEHAASTGATVVSLDYSAAVDANYASNGARLNALIVQGDLYRMPFREAAFDRLFCFGVLQHTPDVPAAFGALLPFVKPGGPLVVDVYLKPKGWRKLVSTRYWVRPITRRLPAPTLYRWCRRYIKAMWPLTRLLHRIPVVGRRIVTVLLVPDYQGVYALTDRVRKEWAILDLFDMLSPRYDQPQTLRSVRGWYEAARFCDVDVRYGYNGVQARGVRPAD